MKTKLIDWTSQRIITLRKAYGMRQDAFATLIRVDISTLQSWEQGIRPPKGPATYVLDDLYSELDDQRRPTFLPRTDAAIASVTPDRQIA